MSSLEIVLTPEQLQTLDDSSEIDSGFPYSIFTQEINRSIFGGAIVQGWQ
ncbi:hypothetical protein H6G17_29740 [Chroococcidiopsis sp. FACHB-1243]|nr:hypothetical protein [Chroococcidiopsis sp. [FACHB-1243]]MBD2309611.1 hypothetical protein [Chroococcidiopsis sp. [FACHB-1243]]